MRVCPECGHKFVTTLRVIWSGSDHCPKCGHVFHDEHPDFLIETHLSRELEQLGHLFSRRYVKYKDNWKGMPFHALMQRLIGEHPDNKGEFTEFMEAIKSGDWEQIRDEGLDSILVLFFIVQAANRKLKVDKVGKVIREAMSAAKRRDSFSVRSFEGLRGLCVHYPYDKLKSGKKRHKSPAPDPDVTQHPYAMGELEEE